MRALTTRQSAIVNFIRDRIKGEGRAPSIREIGRHFQIRSTNGVVCHLRAIEAKKVIACDAHVERGIRLTGSS